MSPVRVFKTEAVAVTITETETGTVSVTVTTLNGNNRSSRSSRPNGLNRPLETNKGKRLFQCPERKQPGRPFKVKTGQAGRPKVLPAGTVELLKQSQNSNVFTHPLTNVKVRFEDAQPPLLYKVDDDVSNCKFWIPILY